MKRIIRISIFASIILIGITFIIGKEIFGIGENVYVVSQDEVNDKEDIKSTDESNLEFKGNNEEINKDEEENINDITIYVSGEVKNPGVITIKNNSRLLHAVEELGGFTQEADLNNVNLAIKLKDEQHYIIPKIGEENISAINQVYSQVGYNSDAKSDKVNINIATIEELDKLPGVGEATANKITSYREENGEFKSIEEIKNVNGIGDKKYEELKELICTN